MKNKKTIVIIIAVIAVIAILGVSFFFINKNTSKTGTTSNKLENLYENLKQNQSYSFTADISDNNKMIYEKRWKSLYRYYLCGIEIKNLL